MPSTRRLLALSLLVMPLFAFAQAPAPVPDHVPDAIALRMDSRKPEESTAGTGTLSIRFCESKVVKYCTQPNRPLKLSGQKLEGVTITPALPGEWRFTSDYALSFTPEKPWRAATRYAVTLPPSLFPPHVKPSQLSYAFTTDPLLADIRTMDYLQDPNDPAKKLVNTTVAFNYPVVKASVEQALTFRIEGADKPLPFTLDTAEDDMVANVTTPVATLEKTPRFMTLDLAATVKAADGSATLAEKGGERKERATLPSLYDYLAISNVGAQALKDAQYVPHQVLTVEANAAVKATDLVKFIDVWVLPKDKPVEGASPKKNYAWSGAAEITPEMRARLHPLALLPQDGAGEATTVNGLGFEAEGGRYLLVKVKKGLPAAGGYELGRDYETIVRAPALPREVRVMAEGALLSLSGEKTLSMLSLGVSTLKYEVSRVAESNVNHLVSQTYGTFANPEFNNEWSLNEKNLSRVFREDRRLGSVDPKRPNYSSFDFSPYLKDGKGLFFLKVSSGDGSITEKRFLLLTDLGLIVKKNLDGSRDVFVQSLAGGGPVEGVDVSVLGLNGEAVASVRTDKDGHALLPTIDQFSDEKRPVAFVAKKDADLSFLPYDRYDRELNYSKFDVNGVTHEEGLKAYLFSDRGIYRPGETAHLGMVVKAQDWAKNLSGLPLVLEVTNPRGQVVNKQLLPLNAEGLIAADFTASESAAAGLYTATLYLGREQGEKGAQLGVTFLRVEEFTPDRMKMTSAFTQNNQPIDGLAWVKPEQLSADIRLMHLYGAPASDRRVTGKIALTPGGFAFQTFKDYAFSAENGLTKTFEQPLEETTTDAEGKAHFAIDLTQNRSSTYRLTFYGEGFEPDSGKSVKTAKTVLVSPLDVAVGVKADGNLSYVSPKDARSVSLIAVDQRLKPSRVEGLTVERKRVKTIQSLAKNSDGTYYYQPTTVETPLDSKPFVIEEGGTVLDLDTKEPGEYLLIVKGKGGAVLARSGYTVVGEANAAAGFTREAQLQLSLDKAAYARGEEMSLSIQSPYTGTGLITLETDKVHAYQWFTAKTTASVQKIRIPEGFEGKGFVNVQFTRDLKSRDIFMSPLSFGVAPFVAGVDARDQKVTLTAPKQVKPGETVTVAYTSKTPGKAVIYAVDEGILLFAKYQNPNPIEYFLMKRGLEVRTAQIMDLLLPEYSILKSLSAAGGDGWANDGKNLNPFKRKTEPPVAYWSGIVETGPEPKNWTFTVPPYFNGGVRLVAVSVSASAMGATENAVSVRGPLIVTPNLPLFATPGDTFVTTATVANQVKGSGPDAKVALVIEPSAQLEILEVPKEVSIPENGEVTVKVRVKATDTLGSGSLRFTAELGDQRASVAQTLSVRPAMPSTTTLASGFSPAKEAEVRNTRALYPEFASVKASVSSLPLSLIGGLRQYLVKYPYGCVEQLTSQNFPNVVLFAKPELAKAFGWDTQAMERAVQVSFDALRERQNDAGGWGIWNYYSEPHGFISAYVMHFLLEARERNLPVPEDVFDSGLRYLKTFANAEPRSLEDAREKAYAIYVLTRAGELTTNYIPHVTDYLESWHKDTWHDDLAAVYLAATYKMLQLNPEAAKLLDAFHLRAPVKYTTAWRDYAFYDSLTKYSQFVYLIARHFPDRLAKLPPAVIGRVAGLVAEGTYNTVSSSYAVMAIDAYVTARKDALADVAIASVANGARTPLMVEGNRLKVAKVETPVETFAFTASQPGFYWQVAQSGYDRTLPQKAVIQGLEVSRQYLGADDTPVTSAKLGEVVTVDVAVRSGNDESQPNIAVVDLLPSGFELVPEKRIEQTEEDAPEAPSDTLGTVASPWTPDFADRREDRIVLYGTAEPEVRHYRYRIRAVAKGTFVTPPPYAESMYDPTIKTHGVAGSIAVELK